MVAAKVESGSKISQPRERTSRERVKKLTYTFGVEEKSGS